MARKCKCRNGAYSTRCCTSKRVRTKSRTKKTGRAKRKVQRDFGTREPEQVLEDITRRQQRRTGMMLGSAGLYYVATRLENRVSSPGVAYGAPRGGSVSGRSVQAGRTAQRSMRGARAARAGALALRIGSKGIPVYGQVSLAYDVYSVADWMFAKGKLPGGTRDRS
jgi:hypothetical protein